MEEVMDTVDEHVGELKTAGTELQMAFTRLAN